MRLTHLYLQRPYVKLLILRVLTYAAHSKSIEYVLLAYCLVYYVIRRKNPHGLLRSRIHCSPCVDDEGDPRLSSTSWLLYVAVVVKVKREVKVKLKVTRSVVRSV